jgi:hypothetical protein
MELLELAPPQLGVTDSGIYVIDDDGAQVLAGPFAEETEALAWIGRTRLARCGCRTVANRVPTRITMRVGL